MRHVANLLLPICLALAACSGAADREERIFAEFGTNPHAAVDKYRAVWNAYDPGDVSDERMVIASELMAWDSERKDIYYEFVIGHLRNADGTYRPYALRALGNAQGVDSLKLLFDAYESGQEPAAHEALFSIKNRYAYAKGVESMRDEQDYIEKRTARLRRQSSPGRVP